MARMDPGRHRNRLRPGPRTSFPAAVRRTQIHSVLRRGFPGLEITNDPVPAAPGPLDYNPADLHR